MSLWLAEEFLGNTPVRNLVRASRSIPGQPGIIGERVYLVEYSVVPRLSSEKMRRSVIVGCMRYSMECVENDRMGDNSR